MDIAAVWRSRRPNPVDAPRAGVQLALAGGITLTLTQECQVALPSGNKIPEVRVTVTSNRPGVAAQINVYANVNSPDGNYQGPTRLVGTGQFTATSSQVEIGFIVQPSGFPVLGVGSEAIWADGEPHSLTLGYWQIACNPWVWWNWFVPVAGVFTR